MAQRAAASGAANPPRRAKKPVNYGSPESSSSVSLDTVVAQDDDDEDEVEEVDAVEEAEEDDADGEEVDAEGESEYESEGDQPGPSAAPSDAMDVDETNEEEGVDGEEDELGDDDDDDDQPLSLPAAQSGMKIKFKLSSSSSSSRTTPTTAAAGARTKRAAPRAAAQKSKSKSKKLALDEQDEDDDEGDELGGEDERGGQAGDLGDENGEDDVDGELDLDSEMEDEDRSASPSKLTARQRARGNQDLQETLLALPMDPGNKKLVLTEAEKLQRREETARKRKRQSEQRIQDEMDTTINRLLRAQTSRSRSKLDNPSPAGEEGTNPSSRASPSRRGPPDNTVRYVSSIVNGRVVLRVAAPRGKEGWIDIGPNGLVDGKPRPPSNASQPGARDMSGECAVDGCGEKRKYRSVKKFEVGGCSLAHLKLVEANIV